MANTLIGSAIREFGIKNFKTEIIEKCTSREQLNEREKFWISHFNCKFPNGYNCTNGGVGDFIHKVHICNNDKFSQQCLHIKRQQGQ